MRICLVFDKTTDFHGLVCFKQTILIDTDNICVCQCFYLCLSVVSPKARQVVEERFLSTEVLDASQDGA